MLLAVDIGNTNIVLGYFKGNRLVSRKRILSNGKFSADVLRKNFDAVVIASVVPSLTRIIVNAIRRQFDVPVIVVSWKMISGLKIALKNKSADRHRQARQRGRREKTVRFSRDRDRLWHRDHFLRAR